MNRTSRIQTQVIEDSRFYLSGKEYRQQRRKRLGVNQSYNWHPTRECLKKAKIRAANKRAKVARERNRA